MLSEFSATGSKIYKTMINTCSRFATSRQTKARGCNARASFISPPGSSSRAPIQRPANAAIVFHSRFEICLQLQNI